MDAVIAIVMTILVLELDKPSAPTFKAFWDLRINFAEYALSFLWLAAMWTSLHNAWHVVDKISGRTMWLSMGLLFFSSLFPYATSLVGHYFFSEAVQGFYGLIVIATTGMLILIYRSLAKDDTRPDTVQYMSHVCRLLLIDIGIKIVGTILGVSIWPPFASIGILIAAVFIAIMRRGNPKVARYRSKVRVLRDEAVSITVSATDRTKSDKNMRF